MTIRNAKPDYATYEILRSNAGYTNYEISKETGISQTTLSDWKRGRSIPKADKLIKIAAALRTTVESFMKEVK